MIQKLRCMVDQGKISAMGYMQGGGIMGYTQCKVGDGVHGLYFFTIGLAGPQSDNGDVMAQR
jgi:hypothetical protein